MADDERPDFDLFNLLQGPANMMNGVRGLADNGRKAIGGLLDTIASLQRAAAALELLASRVDRLVTDLEAPLRLLTPELEKAANRVLRVAEIVEGPIDRLLPGLEQAVSTFERLSVNQLPDNLDALRSQVATVVDVFAELPRKLGSLGSFGAVAQLFPGLERLTSAAARLVPGSLTEGSQPLATAASSPSSSTASKPTPATKKVAGQKANVSSKAPASKRAAPKKEAPKKAAPKKAVSKKAVPIAKPMTSKPTNGNKARNLAPKSKP
jgi:hypothetical protein